MPWDFNNSQPIYAQIVEHIKLMIISGELEIGDKLSSVRELAEEAGVNPNTMQKALSELEKEGLVYSERTSGRFISRDEGLIYSIKVAYAKKKIREMIKPLLIIGYTKEQLIDFIEKELGEFKEQE